MKCKIIAGGRNLFADFECMCCECKYKAYIKDCKVKVRYVMSLPLIEAFMKCPSCGMKNKVSHENFYNEVGKTVAELIEEEKEACEDV